MADISVKQLLQAWVQIDPGNPEFGIPGSRTIEIHGENSLRNIATTIVQALPMDLVWIEQDDNGLPKNPRWGFQAHNPGELPNVGELCPHFDLHIPGKCTTQPTFIDSAHICDVFAGGGHTNWFPCTYDGPIYFDNYSGGDFFGIGEDFDWNWYLDTPDKAGVTAGNHGVEPPANTHMLVLEFDTRETINHFKTPWWNSFHQAVDRGHEDKQYVEARIMVQGHFAIVTGLIGLDCAHECGSESHPVYAMAIHVNDDPVDDTWAMFVRNWGNEGYCSHGDHHFNFQNGIFTFRLPWRSGAQSVVQTDTTFSRNNDAVLGPGVTLLPGKAMLVSFSLPDPDDHPWINGELHLQWVGGSSAPMHPVPTGARSAVPDAAEEGHLARFTTQMTAAQREAFFADVPALPAEPTQGEDMPAAPFVNPPVRGRTPRLGLESLRVQSVDDPVKAELDRRLEERLRAVFGGTIPGLPGE